jgi:hypothetical protein
VDKDVIVFRVMHGYSQVVRTFRRKVLAHRQEVCDAKLSAEVDGLGGSKTAARVNENDAKKNRARKGALNGEYALSDVDLTVYDGVDVVGGRDGHARGMKRTVEMGSQRGAAWAF